MASFLPPRLRAPGRFMGASMGSLLGFQFGFDSGARNTVSQLAELQSPLGNTVRAMYDATSVCLRIMMT